MKILGAMTGTSCDGLDAACIDVNADGWMPLWERSIPFPKALRARVLDIQRGGSRWTLAEVSALDVDLGDWYGASFRKLLAKAPGGKRPSLIANHGQTVGHFPHLGATLQLGDPTRIAEITGITTLSHFRQGDMAAGGQGAPLLPLFHREIAHAISPRTRGAGIALHNLGGISNLTWIGTKETLAFDTGPANIWIDRATQKATHGKLSMDRGGKLAQTGVPDERVIARILKYPYFAKNPPKSTGRDDFTIADWDRESRGLRGADAVATATLLTARSVAHAYRQWVLRRKEGRGKLRAIYFCGGGARNPTLLSWIQMELPEVEICRLDDAGFDSQWIEAQGFAYFGYRSLLGHAIGGEWTGAKTFGPPGQITPGRNWNQVLATLRGTQSRR